METLEFKSLEEFHQWKEKIERETCSSYVKRRGVVKRPNGDLLLYYNCNRSGKYIPSGKGLRKIKPKSLKIGSDCSASLRIKITNSNQKIIVKYFKHHDKHPPQLEHLRLPSSVRASIASKLKSGVPVRQIISGIREASSKSVMNRIFLVNSGSMQNIIRDFKVEKKIKKQKLDAETLKSWITDMISKCPDDPTLSSSNEPSSTEDSVFPSSKESNCQNVSQNDNIANHISSGSGESGNTIFSPITKALTFIELYKTCKHKIDEMDIKKLNEHLNILIDICAKGNKFPNGYLDSLRCNSLSRRTEEEPVILFKEKNVTINSSTKSSNDKINANVTEELFELEQVFEESTFYQDNVAQDYSNFDDDILGEVLNIHTEFDHSYL